VNAHLDGIFHFLVQMGSIGRRGRQGFRESLKRARGYRGQGCATAECGIAAVGRIVNGLNAGDRIKDDGRAQVRVSREDVLIPAHPELLQVLLDPESARRLLKGLALIETAI
jgi:hypothetical protein